MSVVPQPSSSLSPTDNCSNASAPQTEANTMQLPQSSGGTGDTGSITSPTPNTATTPTTSPVVSGSAISPPVSSNAISFSATNLATSSSNSSNNDNNNQQLLGDCDPARLAALSAGYPRSLGSMYSAAAAAASYPSTEQNPYPSIAMENSFYGSLVSSMFILFTRLADYCTVASLYS